MDINPVEFENMRESIRTMKQRMQKLENKWFKFSLSAEDVWYFTLACIVIVLGAGLITFLTRFTWWLAVGWEIGGAK